MGAGLAGIMAALQIKDKQVILASNSCIASGSSFYPGTWGLGVVGPDGEDDEEDMEKTINLIGCDMADPLLVHTLVTSITKQIHTLQKLDLPLKQAVSSDQKEFIPCFDHKQRNWNGLLTQSSRTILQHHLEKNHIVQLLYHEVVDIIMKDQAVCGVVVLDSHHELCYIGCKSIIIASGGFGGLFQYRLNTSDVSAMGQYLALKCGASLINIEFHQMMTGFLSPARATIYNEKFYEYTSFTHRNSPIFTGCHEKELLKQRSTYGPFTSRLASRDIDITLYKIFREDHKGVTIHHDPSLRYCNIEFIQTYRTWLEEEKHIRIEDEIQIGTFYHAANGGIRIDESASTGIAGLYACGEVSGGMHGADRLGGVASANALVFGSIAGEQAAAYASSCKSTAAEIIEYDDICYEEAAIHLEEVRAILFQNVMVVRTEEGLQTAYQKLKEIEQNLVPCKSQDISNPVASYHLRASLLLGKAMITACLMRRESRGSHYREDYPHGDPTMNSPIIVSGFDKLQLQFQDKKVGAL